MSRKLLWLSGTIIAFVIALSWAPAIQLNFYGDDYSFLEIAGRSTLPQYLSFYFDPRQQTGWYRPLQGMFFGIEYVLFGNNPTGYHVVNVLVHLANCWLLFAILWRIAKKIHAALIAVLIYAGLPLYSVAVFWPGDADFLLTCFYLLSMLLWVLFLQERRRSFYVAAIAAFLLALLTKEFGVTLPVMLFLIDRLLLFRPTHWTELARRYAPFLLVWALYLPMEYFIQSRSVLTSLYGYGIGTHTFLNFVQYLAWLAFPWGLPDPINFIWLAFVTTVFFFVVVVKRNGQLLFLGMASVLAFLPVISFPWFFTRYLYLSAMTPVVVLAFLIDPISARFANRRWFASGVGTAVALIVLVNSLGIASATADFAEIGRQTRVAFRDISQRHPTFPADTHLYFIDPPQPTSQYSGMFFLRYGADIHVASNEYDTERANLNDHRNSYVIWFDVERRTRELPVDATARAATQLAEFDAPIQLLGYEMPSAQARRGEAFVIILYWQATQKIEQDYSMSLYLRDAMSGDLVATLDGAPRSGKLPTSIWRPGELIVDARVVVVPPDARLGNDYALEIGVYDPATQQGLARPPIVLAPLSIIE